MRIRPPESPALLIGIEAAGEFFSGYFAAADGASERLWVAHVDEAARCIHVACYDGDSASVGVPVRQIVEEAARLGSAGVVLAHNHPGGDARPSKADHRATRRLVRAGDAIGLAVLDHLIFAGARWSSMRRAGLL